MRGMRKRMAKKESECVGRENGGNLKGMSWLD